MRLYNAASCTPMGTSSSGFGTRKFSKPYLPSAAPKPAAWKSVRLRKTNSKFVKPPSSQLQESPPGIRATSTNSTDALTATPPVSKEEVESVISEKIPALRSLEEYLENAIIVNVDSEDTGTISTFSTRCSVAAMDHQHQHTAVAVPSSTSDDIQDDEFSPMFEDEFTSPLAQQPPKGSMIVGSGDYHREPWPSRAEIRDEPLQTPPNSNDTTERHKNDMSNHRQVSPVKALFPESPTKVLFDDFRSVKLRRVASNSNEQASLPDSVVVEQQRARKNVPRRPSAHQASPISTMQQSQSVKMRSEWSPGVGQGDAQQSVRNGRWDWAETSPEDKKVVVVDASPASASSPVIRNFRSPFDLSKSARTPSCTLDSLMQRETKQPIRYDYMQVPPSITGEREMQQPVPVSSLFDEIKPHRLPSVVAVEHSTDLPAPIAAPSLLDEIKPRGAPLLVKDGSPRAIGMSPMPRSKNTRERPSSTAVSPRFDEINSRRGRSTGTLQCVTERRDAIAVASPFDEINFSGGRPTVTAECVTERPAPIASSSLFDDITSRSRRPTVTVERVTERPAPIAVSALFDEINSRRRVASGLPLVKDPEVPRSVVVKSSSHVVSSEPPSDFNPVYAKYKDMLKKGVPPGAVQNAMIRDGVDPAGLDLGINAQIGGAPSGNRLPAVKDKYRRTRLHWQTHDGVKSNTIWGMVERDPDLTCLKVDEREFQSLFRSESGVSEKPRAMPTNTGSKVRVIDAKRANNGGIILARLKLPYDQIARAVDTFDYNALTSEQIRGILPFVASPEEEEALVGLLQGGRVQLHSLCECEKFMITMMNVQHAKRKLEAILFMQSFPSTLEEVRRGAEVITEACKEITGSSRLRKVLGIVLELGNRLNTAGSRRGRARAITLNSLPKLKQAKAFDKKTTFLHFVAKVVRENNGNLIHFKDDISTVFKAEKVQMEQLEVECHKLTRVLEEVRKFVLHLSGEYSESVIRNDQILLNSSFGLSKDVEIQNKSMVGRFCLNGCMRLNAVVNEVAKGKEQVDNLIRYFGEHSYQDDDPMSIIATFTREFETAVDDVIQEDKAKMRELRGIRKTVSTDSRDPPRIPQIRSDSSHNTVKSNRPQCLRVFSDIKKKRFGRKRR